MTTQTMTERAQRIGFAPITRIDTATREIEVTATSEALDAYGTIFDYAASRAAFARWLGNVREMHDALAVGKRVAVEEDDAQRQIRVRLRISRGAESTWQKILDGTLCGASIGAANVTWREARLGEVARAEDIVTGNPDATVRVATAYDLVELSLVDNPANPDCVGVTVIRGTLPDVEVLDELGEDGDTEGTEIHGMPRRGLTETRNDAKWGEMTRDVDGGAGLAPPPGPLPTAVERGNDAEQRAVLAASRQAAAGVALLRGMVERMAQEQHEALAQLGARLARIEQQPTGGGPTLRAAEKVLGAPMGNPAMNVAERIAALQAFAAGRPDQHTQVEVAAEILRLQRGAGE